MEQTRRMPETTAVFSYRMNGMARAITFACPQQNWRTKNENTYRNRSHNARDFRNSSAGIGWRLLAWRRA
jgi:hypothetical protein